MKDHKLWYDVKIRFDLYNLEITDSYALKVETTSQLADLKGEK